MANKEREGFGERIKLPKNEVEKAIKQKEFMDKKPREEIQPITYSDNYENPAYKDYASYAERVGAGQAMPKDLFDRMKREKEISEFQEKARREPEEKGRYYMDPISPIKRVYSDNFETPSLLQPGQPSPQPQQPTIQQPQLNPQPQQQPQQIQPQPQQQPQIAQPNPQEELKKAIIEAQKNRQISAIEQAYQKNVGGLQAEKAIIDPMFSSQTRQAATQGAMAKKSFSDFLAEKGLSASGLSGQAELSQNVATQGQLGDIEARRGQAVSDIARRTSEVEQARQFGIQGAESEASMTEAESKLNDLLKQQEIARQDSLRQEQYGREDRLRAEAIQREDQLIKQGYSREDAQRQAENERQDKIRQEGYGREDVRYAQSEIQRQQEISRQDQLRQQAIQREDQLIQQGYTREDAQRQAEIERVAKANQESKAERDAAQSRIDFAATINPKEDLTAKLNELEKQGVPQDDYRVIELKKARINKIANMDQANFERELANIKVVDDQQEAALAFAWKKFSAGLPADPITARLLGVDVGQIIPEQRIRDAQLKLDQIRANKTSSSTTEKKQATENYRAFELDYSNLLANDPSKATNLVKANREELIRQKGLNAYNSLLNQAEKATIERLKQQQKSQYNFYPQP